MTRILTVLLAASVILFSQLTFSEQPNKGVKKGHGVVFANLKMKQGSAKLYIVLHLKNQENTKEYDLEFSKSAPFNYQEIPSGKYRIDRFSADGIDGNVFGKNIIGAPSEFILEAGEAIYLGDWLVSASRSSKGANWSLKDFDVILGKARNQLINIKQDYGQLKFINYFKGTSDKTAVGALSDNNQAKLQQFIKNNERKFASQESLKKYTKSLNLEAKKIELQFNFTKKYSELNYNYFSEFKRFNTYLTSVRKYYANDGLGKVEYMLTYQGIFPLAITHIIFDDIYLENNGYVTHNIREADMDLAIHDRETQKLSIELTKQYNNQDIELISISCNFQHESPATHYDAALTGLAFVYSCDKTANEKFVERAEYAYLKNYGFAIHTQTKDKDQTYISAIVDVLEGNLVKVPSGVSELLQSGKEIPHQFDDRMALITEYQRPNLSMLQKETLQAKKLRFGIDNYFDTLVIKEPKSIDGKIVNVNYKVQNRTSTDVFHYYNESYYQYTQKGLIQEISWSVDTKNKVQEISSSLSYQGFLDVLMQELGPGLSGMGPLYEAKYLKLDIDLSDDKRKDQQATLAIDKDYVTNDLSPFDVSCNVNEKKAANEIHNTLTGLATIYTCYYQFNAASYKTETLAFIHDFGFALPTSIVTSQLEKHYTIEQVHIR